MTSPLETFRALSALVSNADPQSVPRDLPLVLTADNLAREPMARRIGAFMEWRKRGGFELVGVHSQDAGHIDLEIRFPISRDHWRLRLVLAEDGSGLIDEMLMGRAPLPHRSGMLSDQQIADEFVEYIQDLGRHDLFSGAALIGRHNQVLGSVAVGQASREYARPNTVDTLFNVASLTKSWTAVAAMRLIEAGKLALETPVRDLVSIENVSLDARIQVRHVLSHTAGLGDYFGAAFNTTAKDRIRTLDDFLAMAGSFDPVFEPGTSWAYSNIGMMVLGKVIEKVTGVSYYAAVKSLVFDPAGMTTACFPDLDEVQTGCASGYGQKWTDQGPVAINALHSWAVRGGPDGCAFASLADIWAFSNAFRNGRLVSPENVVAMTSAKPELGALDYGYGFSILPERAVVGHSGGLIGASANLDMINDPVGWTVVVLANDLSMRTPVIKARHMIGVTVQERDDAQTQMPRAGLTAR